MTASGTSGSAASAARKVVDEIAALAADAGLAAREAADLVAAASVP